MFIALGWRGVIAYYGTHGRSVHRWMREEGWDDLVADRAAYRSRLQDRDRAFRRRAAMFNVGSAGVKLRQHLRQNSPVGLRHQPEGLQV